LWNYEQRTLEVCEVFNEETYTVAFHPSGFHLLVALHDRIRMLNVIQNTLGQYKELPVKQCREIRFAHGGHLFAAGSNSAIHVYKFYTAENPPELTFKLHESKVKCIDWFEDDTGFVSGGWDGSILVCSLKDNKAPLYRFNVKSLQFNSVVKVPEVDMVYAVGNDKTIKQITKGELTLNYESGVKFNELALYYGGRAIFAGMSEEDKPGSITVYALPDRICEV